MERGKINTAHFTDSSVDERAANLKQTLNGEKIPYCITQSKLRFLHDAYLK